MPELTGKATIFVDGQQLYMENAAKLNPGGITRQYERHGGKTYYREEETPPSIEGNLLHSPDTDLTTVGVIKGATAIFDCDTGQKYVLRDCSSENPPELDASTGKAPIKLVGDSCDKM